MIISASRRTDLPAFYSEWLCNRFKDGFVLVRNPMNIHQVGKVILSPEVVDGIVFWTKNPTPMLNQLKEFEKYTYYFQFTLTAYDRDVEPNLPSKNEVLIPTFKELSNRIGSDKVIWRYDPILLNERYTMEYHCKYFKILSSILGEYTEKCTVSFIDLYRNTVKNVKSLNLKPISFEQQVELLNLFSEIAAKYGIYVDTCSENIELEKYNIPHACCIDKKKIKKIGNCKLSVEKDAHQRKECGCVSSIDIGTYNTCPHGCFYCHANFNSNIVIKNATMHDPKSPLLFGSLDEQDIIKVRQMNSCKEKQLGIFDFL